MIVIVDYGMGNLGSILNMLNKVGAEAAISSDVTTIETAEKIILPGVGAFDTGMQRLADRQLLDVLNHKAIDEKTLILGVCLGMQLLTKMSEEGRRPGLGWIDAETIRFRLDPKLANLKVPHMGWNTVEIKRPVSLFQGLSKNPRFYFVHSYHVVCNQTQDILTTTHHGYSFASSIQQDNILGVQFHPEKSHRFGMKLLRNFARMTY